MKLNPVPNILFLLPLTPIYSLLIYKRCSQQAILLCESYINPLFDYLNNNSRIP